MKKKPTKILFIINGLGLGNSTRATAIIQALTKYPTIIDVITSGNSTTFFQQQNEIQTIFSIEQPRYNFSSTGRLLLFKTLLSIPRILYQLFRNAQSVHRVLLTQKPDIVILDSQYLPLVSKKYNIPFAAINNSSDSFPEFLRLPLAPMHLYFHFLFFECLDFVYHKLFYRTVFWLRLPKKLEDKEKVVLLVRQDIQALLPRKIENILVMFSGATLNAPSFNPRAWKTNLKIDVLGLEGNSTNNVFFHGKVLNNLSFLKQADLLVINGGFSAISEAIALRKPTLVVPIPGHAEQYSNAKCVQQLGIGLLATPENVEVCLNKMLANIDTHLKACRQLDFETNRADQIAREIMDLADRRSI